MDRHFFSFFADKQTKKNFFKVDVGGLKQNLQQQGYWQIDEQIERINQQKHFID